MAPSRPVVIFDLDDTLIHSFDPYVSMHQRIARELGLRVPAAQEFVAYGPTWEATLARIWPQTDLKPFFAKYETLADDFEYRQTPGASAAVTQLRAEGRKLFVVTRRTKLRLEMRLAQAELRAADFDGIFTAEDQPAQKPDPRCFEPVWSALGRAEPRAIYVGDRDEDRQAAAAAGLTFLAVQTGPEAQSGFPHDHPESHTLAHASQVVDWLGSGHA